MKTMIQTLPDSDLFKLFQNGERSALEEIYILHADFLFSYALKRLNSSDIAADLIQELFYKLWVKKAGIQLKGEIRSYLTLCLRNMIIDHYSHEVVKTKYLSKSGAILIDVDNGTADQLAYRETYQVLQHAISNLPQKMQRILHLSKIKEYTIDEISDELQLSKQTVKNQLGLAIKRLKVSFGVFFTILPAIFTLFQK